MEFRTISKRSRIVRLDDADADLAELIWYSGTWAAWRFIADRNHEFLHRVIAARMGIGDAQEIDHVNRNPYDNRRVNLRAATHAQNQQNKGIYRNNRSGHRGVFWDAARSKWAAQVKLGGQRHLLGRFNDLGEAGAAASEWRRAHMPYSND